MIELAWGLGDAVTARLRGMEQMAQTAQIADARYRDDPSRSIGVLPL